MLLNKEIYKKHLIFILQFKNKCKLKSTKYHQYFPFCESLNTIMLISLNLKIFFLLHDNNYTFGK